MWWDGALTHLLKALIHLEPFGLSRFQRRAKHQALTELRTGWPPPARGTTAGGETRGQR